MRGDLGAILRKGGTDFTLWAPNARKVQVILTDKMIEEPLHPQADGYHTAFVKDAGAGTLYKFRLNGQDYPDPCSRFQPEGPFGPSMIVDRDMYRWRDHSWRGPAKDHQVLYEMHIGTFTPEGTFKAASKKLKELRWLGITAIEVMPVAEAAGRWGWGYDGVDLFAPNHHYGDYNALKAFVDDAHACGLAVILDVVYNHLGPSGNFLSAYSPAYFTKKHRTDWGDPINFYGDKSSADVRHFFRQNALYWIRDFHLDGLRFDATQNIYDQSTPHILSEISQQCRKAAGKRSLLLIAENNEQDIKILQPVENGGWGMDAVWADDFHHAARVAVSGLREAYTSDYTGLPPEIISSLRQGYLFQGQYSAWCQKRLGTPVGKTPAGSFVFYLQNHDQIANSLKGERIHSITTSALYRVYAAILLLAPQTPLLFMGQEFGARSPFLYFSDQEEALADSIRKGRREFLKQFPSVRKRETELPDPLASASFRKSKINHRDRSLHRPLLHFHRDLLNLRRSDPVISRQDRESINGVVITRHVFLIRFGTTDDCRLLVINTGKRFDRKSLAEPLIAPPSKSTWSLMWRSDVKRYGGQQRFVLSGCEWSIPQHSALLFRPKG